jgi:protein tyrosine/serine phosphatase
MKVSPAARRLFLRCNLREIMTTQTRRVQPKGPLEGIENFRDFGGYAGPRGRLKTATLFRSGHHGRASDADLEALGAHGFDLIVDLRRQEERELEPSRRWKGFSADVISNDLANESTETWISFVARTQPSERALHDYMLDYYRAAPFEPRHIDLFVRYFEALSRTGGPLLVHCAAGKDRTGVLVALTQALVGVKEDDIVGEFLLTNASARFAERAPLVAEYLAPRIGRAPDPWILKTALSVEPDYLHAAFDAIRERSGSLEAYLSDVMTIDRARRNAIESRILD